MIERFCAGRAKHATMALLFVLFFAFFAIKNPYYLPTTLTVRTDAPAGTEATLLWDSGSGFTPRERVAFVPFREAPFEDKVHLVELTRMAPSGPASQGSEAWVDSIVIDGGKTIDLSTLVQSGQAEINDNGKLALQALDQTVRFQLRFTEFGIAFLKHPWAGQVRVAIDGEARNFDLYSPDTMPATFRFQAGALPGGAEHRFPMPQTKVRNLQLNFSSPEARVEALEVASASGTRSLEVSRLDASTYVVRGPDFGNVRSHPFLLGIQAFVAFLMVVVASLVWDFIARRRGRGLAALAREVFVANDRPVFWGMALIAVAVYGTWWLGQWPGIMTVDSFHFTWREIKTLQLQNVTPWVFNAYVLALTQFWDSPAVVPLFQILAMALLGAGIFFFCYRQGAPKWLVALCYVFFVGSIPIALYNLVIWKDIPFCLTMLFWGAMLYYLHYQKTCRRVVVSPSAPTLVAMAASLLFMATVRHNGIIFMVAIPAILALFRLLPTRRLLGFAGATALGFALYIGVTTLVAGQKADDVKEFFATTYRVGPMAAIYTSNLYYSPDREGDRALIDRWMSPEELRAAYTPVSQAASAGRMVDRWMAMEPADRARLNQLYVNRGLQNLHLVVGDRIAMFLGTLGLSSNIFIITNELYHSGDMSPWRPIESYRLHLAPKSAGLFDLSARIMAEVTTFQGRFPLPLLIFNTLPPLLLLLGCLLAYKYTPSSAIFSFVFLYNLPFLFIVLSTCEWRYFYFIVLASYFVLPLMAVELVARRCSRKDARTSSEHAQGAIPVA